jgi:hypothetical protein
MNTEHIRDTCCDAHTLRTAVDHLVLAGLKAVRAIPDGEIRRGCVVYDGSQVRDDLRDAINGLITLSPQRSGAADSETS